MSDDLTELTETLAKAVMDGEMADPAYVWEEMFEETRDAWRQAVAPLVAAVAPLFAEREAKAWQRGYGEGSMPEPDTRSVNPFRSAVSGEPGGRWDT